jgi:hypothetical protein
MSGPRTPSPARRERLGAAIARALTTCAVLLAVVAWLVLPAAHLGGAHAGCCADRESVHDDAGHHHRCCGHAHGCSTEAAHEHEDDEPDHDPGTCPVCQLGLLSPSGPVVLGRPLPTPEQTRAVAGPEPLSVPRSSPQLTDAPPRGPPPSAAV